MLQVVKSDMAIYYLVATAGCAGLMWKRPGSPKGPLPIVMPTLRGSKGARELIVLIPR